jgi:NAD(P)-dependent dehydrogenase (short-subunit alcohol dehydrogenase family)
MGRIDGKTSIVTGGAHGIGKATAQRLAEEGASVALTDVDDEAGEAAAEAIAENGGTAQYWSLDVTDETAVQDVFAEVADTFGGIDVLVNNAGISGTDKPTHELTEEEWNEVIDVNVNGVFYCTKHAVPHMQDGGGGSIVNLSSIYGIVGAEDIPPYHASKGAVRTMTKTDALQYADDDIRVNSVHPGFIWTPLVEEFLGRGGDVEEGRKQLDELHPIGHVGEPVDIANGILFLASDESKFMTGSELVIDGGYTAQ